MTKQEFAQYIQQADFRNLFAELGWDNNRELYTPIAIKTANGKAFSFDITPIAMQAGFRVLHCAPLQNGELPDSGTRQRIATALHKRYPEHLLIFTDAKKTSQVWNVVLKRKDQPLRHSAVRWSKGQDVETVWQRIFRLAFTIREAEDGITILKVTARVESGFAQNADPIVKKFYTAFSKQHKDFYAFVKGIDDHIDALNKKAKKDADKQENKNKQWYVSLMLNRLMFCYFIQKKNFLNRDPDYLRNKLKESKTRKGKNKFYSFYRDFLLHLFHEGLGNPTPGKELKEMIGRIPYLNGGLFDVHELEEQFEEIQIDDEAFDNIFSFFDQWSWHLDAREQATGKDINPDVIGYIFERYINERAKMGAYYTKEDITEYISRNCILPWLWEETERRLKTKKSREDEENISLAEFVKASGDSYIYPAVKHGVNEPLPAGIEAGIKEVSKRTNWNKPAPATHALPTEIWREVVARRQRYEEVCTKIKKGEVASITDFITYNLEIRAAVQDYIAQCTDPAWLRAFWESLKEMTVLDPTCGSGAFLFAAMSILEPLYEVCIERMGGFIDDEDHGNAADKARFQNRFKDFRTILQDIKNPEKHPSKEYYVYKSIILRNLYGVDIMKEAVEIAKLRLFLKLVGCVDADFSKGNLGLEPLPDVDFKVRAGNTLVGFATAE
ncbi:MAG TPA: hypothetical protein PL009_12730, partial [Flavipsychrobacter sp.]|nr:hypothetical protein [Flavipsychrobacter sp.]